MTAEAASRPPLAVEVRDLGRRFGARAAVEDVSFHVDPGTSLGLLGLNGAGKTTTLRVLTGLLRPSTGTARVDGRDVTAPPTATTRPVGFVTEASGKTHLDWLVPDYLAYFGAARGLPRRESLRRARPLLEALLPQASWNAPLRTLSGGMRKKVELVRALLPEPAVLFLDEPTKDLDLPSKRAVWAFLHDAVHRRGLTLVLTSHDAAELRALCERIVILRAGRIVHEGRVADLPPGERFEAALAALLTGPMDSAANPTARRDGA